VTHLGELEGLLLGNTPRRPEGLLGGHLEEALEGLHLEIHLGVRPGGLLALGTHL
jgi:hypothetical protein